MIQASIRTFFILMILLTGYSRTMDPLLDPAHPMFATERNTVLNLSAHDPCSRGGLWFAMDEDTRTEATDDCELAFDYFMLLTDDEKRSCPGAREPACRPGFGCSPFEFKCTFLCRSVPERGWTRQNSGARRLERTPSRVWMPRDLRTIAATVVEPRLIPEGFQPFAYSRGHRRTYPSLPPQED